MNIPGLLNTARTGGGLLLRSLAGAVILLGTLYGFTLLLGSGGDSTTAPKSAGEDSVVTAALETGSPLLGKLESEGLLPPAAERTGPEPEILPGTAGRYGGDLWLLAHDIDEVRIALQYSYKGDNLLRFSPEGLPMRGHLAKSVEPSNDFRTWRVTLRAGMKWSDGHPFTTQDFIWWAENIWGDKSMGSVPEVWRSGSGPARLEAESDTVFLVHFPDARPDWPQVLASPAGSLYLPGPRQYLEKYHPRLGDPAVIKQEGGKLGLAPRELFFRKAEMLNPNRPVLGPWRLASASHQGPWTAVRNPYYPVVDKEGRQLPYLDRLVFRQVSTPLQARAITDGVVSFAWKVQVDYPSLLNESKGSRYHLLSWKKLDRNGMTIVPNRRLRVPRGDQNAAARSALLLQPEFRRALSLAINRRAVIAAEFDGIGEPGAFGPAPGDFGYDPVFAQSNTAYDPARANALLDELGLTRRDSDGFRLGPGGERLSFEIISRPGGASPLEFITEFWEAVGIRVTAREKPHRLFLRSVETADFAVGSGVGVPMPGMVGALGAQAPFFMWLSLGGLAGNAEAAAPGVDQPDPIEQQALQLAAREVGADNEARHLEIIQELQHLARENVWTINIYSPGPESVVVKNTLQNVPKNAAVAFEIGTPFNTLPETWFWQNPETINGVDPAPPAYLADREASILASLTPSAPTPENPETSPDSSSALISGLFTGLVLILLALAVLRHPYLLRRLALMVPTLLVISIVVFVGVQLPPGSYLETVTDTLRQQGNSGAAQEEIARLEELYHLNAPLPVQYLRWMGFSWFVTFSNQDKGVLQGNLGRSMANGNRPVAELIGDRLILTMALSLGAILIHWFVALPIGVYSAVRQNTPADYALTVGGLIGMCIPDFILALLAILAAKQFFGMVTIGLFSSQYAMQAHWDWPKFVNLLQHIWVPVLIIGTSSTAGLIRVIRANLLDELRKPYVVTARAKGVPPLRLLLKYPFRLALNPFISGIGGIFPALISGSAIVSIILSLPTTGPLLYDAVMLEDTYMAGSLLLCLSALSILGILVSDLLLILLDPRIRFGGNSR